MKGDDNKLYFVVAQYFELDISFRFRDRNGDTLLRKLEFISDQSLPADRVQNV